MRSSSTLRTVQAGALTVALIAAAAACGTSGRELREVPPGQTAPPRSTSSLIAPATTVPAPVGFTLSSAEWINGGSVPDTYSCSTEGISPPLAWVNVSPQVTELALVVVDPDAGDFVHWVVTGIPLTTTSVDAGSTPAGGIPQTNTGGETGWFPLCPPPGEIHNYQFELLGFVDPPTIDATDPAMTTVASLREQAIDQTVLLGTFGR